jgi:hypothetical protein
MRDRDWVDRFNNDVDQLLKIGELPDPVDRTTDEYAGALLVAKTLSSIDFSSESKKRHTLRHRLLTEIDTGGGWSQHIKESVSMNTQFQKHGIKPAFSVIILVGFLGLLFANLIWPGSVAAAAQSAVSFVQRFWVGEYTSINSVTTNQIFEKEDGNLAILSEYSNEDRTTGITLQDGSGSVVALEIRKFDNLAEAQVILPFHLTQPGFLPEAYVFSHVNVFGEGDNASAHIHYYGLDGDLLLSQRPIGGQTDQTVSIGLPDDYGIELVLVNDNTATWTEHILMWEADGVSYLMSSSDLNQADAIRIAESLK